MNSLVASLLWLLIGLVVGVLALAARLLLTARGSRRQGWLLLLALGALSGLLGGWLCALLLGPLFGTAAALWLSVLAVVVASRIGREEIGESSMLQPVEARVESGEH